MKIEGAIRNARKKRGMTQQALANVLLVSKATIAAWELGIQRPRLERLPAIADALKIKIGELV